jgi:hypothetical protein
MQCKKVLFVSKTRTAVASLAAAEHGAIKALQSMQLLASTCVLPCQSPAVASLLQLVTASILSCAALAVLCSWFGARSECVQQFVGPALLHTPAG